MRIAFVTFGNFDGHATLKRATGMASPLTEAGHEVHLLLEDAPVNHEKVDMECPRAKVHWHKRAASAKTERKAKQATLNSIQPDIVWICGVGLRNWMRRPSKGTVLLADHSELYSKVACGGFRRLAYSFLEWAYCLSFDGQICASRYLEAFYRKRLKRLKINQSRVHYSPYAYHPQIIRPDYTRPSLLQSRYPSKKIVLYMGSFWENYGFWDMLEAFKRLSSARDDFVAILAGRGPEKERGISWIKQHSLEQRIVIEGYVPEEELSGYFGAAHAFLSPLRDTVQDRARCPSKLYMYLPFKKPVITCPIGEAKELFGENGSYYNPCDVDNLTTVINSVLDESDPLVKVDPAAHTYGARTIKFLAFYETTFGRN